MAQDVAALIQALSPLLLDKKSSTTRSVSPALTGQFNQLFNSLLPQTQKGVVSDDELTQLLNSIMTQGQRAFAPNMALQAEAGGYNSTSLEAIKGDAMAKATDQSLQSLINAKLASAQQQSNASQVLTQLLGAQANNSFTQSETGAAPMGGLAAPLAGYALVKQLMGDGGLLGKKAGGVSIGDGGAPLSYSLASTPLASLAPASAGQSLGNVGSSAIGSSIIPAIPAAAANTAANYDLLSSITEGLDGMGDIGEGAFSYSAAPAITAGSSALPAFDFSGAESGAASAAGASATAGTAQAAGGISSLSNDALMSWVRGGLSDVTSAIGEIPYIGSGIAEVLGTAGDTMSSIGDFFTPSVNIPGLGPTGVPILAGLGNFMEGEYAQGAGDIAATMALNAIPGIGTALSLISGFTKNGVLDDWFGVEDCYITTATMEATGNSDDNSYELTTMRKFRDSFMKATPAGQELIDNYYQVAPKVVAKLNARSDAKHVYMGIYNNYLAPAIAAIEAGDNYHALSIYRAMSQYAEHLANQK